MAKQQSFLKTRIKKRTECPGLGNTQHFAEDNVLLGPALADQLMFPFMKQSISFSAEYPVTRKLLRALPPTF